MRNGFERRLVVLAAALALAACGPEEEIETAAPADTIAPAPKDTVLVPGAGEPGPQELP